jgi:uncharacterized alpha-E superfamily protein
MPSVGTWWCGEPAALEEVIARLDQLIIKPSFPQLRQFPVFGKDLKGNTRAAFIKKMRAHPQNFVAQDLVHLSQAPIWKSNSPLSLTASAIGLRVYACATPNGYVVMPGGLTRVATGPDSRVLAMQRGGGSKDTWILANDKAEALNSSSRTKNNKELIRDDIHLSSRVAENLYWFGRYAERCDNISRLMRTTLDLLVNTPAEFRRDEWPTIQALCVWSRLISPSVNKQAAEQALTQSQSQHQGQTQSQETSTVSRENNLNIQSDAQIEAALLRALVSTEVPGLANQLQHLHRIASQLRERLSMDNWRSLNQMMQRFSQGDQALTLSDANVILDETITYLMTLAGFALDGMTRDKGWRFLSIGRRIERLQFLCTLLQHGLNMKAGSNLDWLLEMSDSIVTYRSRYMARPEWVSVLDLLVLDESNPRSVVFQLEGILSYLNKLANTYGACGAEILAPLLKELLALEPATQLRGNNPELINLLMRVSRASGIVSEQIGLRFFSYTGDAQTSK